MICSGPLYAFFKNFFSSLWTIKTITTKNVWITTHFNIYRYPDFEYYVFLRVSSVQYPWLDARKCQNGKMDIFKSVAFIFSIHTLINAGFPFYHLPKDKPEDRCLAWGVENYLGKFWITRAVKISGIIPSHSWQWHRATVEAIFRKSGFITINAGLIWWIKYC